MNKKKRNQAAHDLIDSLMDDLKDIASSESSIKENLDPAGLFDSENSEINEEEFAVGLGSDDFRVEEDVAGLTAWSDNIKSPPRPASSMELNAPKIEESFSASLPEVNNYGKSEGKEFGFQSDPEEAYQGPSAGEGLQSIDDIFDGPISQNALKDEYGGGEDEKTRPIKFDSDTTRPVGFSDEDITGQGSQAADPDRTLAAEGFAAARPGRRNIVDEKVGIGSLKSSAKQGGALTFSDASLVQAENLKIAQMRILSLEKEVEKLRGENEELASAADIIKARSDEYQIRIKKIEKDNVENEDSHRSELLIFKGNLQYKENEVAKARLKVEELEFRLKNDFKKIRVKERELENRLELARAEKAALLRSKDEYILDLKRKIDHIQSELDNYRGKVLELNKSLDSNQEQFKRTVRALRLALNNLELKEGESFPLKKAE